MNRRKLVFGALSVAAAITAFACTGSYLFDERRSENLPADRAIVFDGELCTPGATEVQRPIKISIAIDASESMNVTDPLGTRAQAVVDLINSLPNEPEVYISVLLFAGSTSSYLTKDANGLDGFAQVTSLSDTDKLLLQAQILNFVNTDTSPNRDATDFLKPLSDLYALISTDIARSRAAVTDGGEAVRARYTTIFLSDGHPSICQDPQLICNGSPPVSRIVNLRDLADDVRFHTVHAFNPLQPVSSICDLDGGTGQFNVGGCVTYCQSGVPGIQCPNLIINQDIDRLRRMAAAGNGTFRSFRNNEPISFLNFDLGQVRRAFELRELVVTNFSAPPGSPLDVADTDGDRLTDTDELQRGTDPWRKDTDGDGFSDGVEVNFGGTFDPAQVALPDGGGLDPGCPQAIRASDSDCDGLLDCDEQLIGTNGNRADSDSDGVPDSVEWQMLTQGSSPDMSQDPDTDSLSNREEVRMHLDPLVAGTAQLTVLGYRYSLTTLGAPEADGKQCYHFRVENVALAPTMADLRTDGGTGRQAAYNDLMVSFAMVPSDDPSARTIIKSFRTSAPRYPVGGIKSPADGVIPVGRDDFVEGCAVP